MAFKVILMEIPQGKQIAFDMAIQLIVKLLEEELEENYVLVTRA